MGGLLVTKARAMTEHRVILYKAMLRDVVPLGRVTPVLSAR